MTSARIFYFFDLQTLKILGYFVFQGTLSNARVSENREDIVIKVENYYPIPLGDIIPIREDEVLKVRVSDLEKRGFGVGFSWDETELKCGEDAQKVMGKAVVKAAIKLLENIRKLGERIEEERKQLEMKRMVYANMPLFASSKIKS